MTRLRLITRIALFSALIYVFSWMTAYFPNFNLIFFLVFAAGFMWGVLPGVLVGAVGMALWTFFNPYGPAPLPIMFSQILGASLGGIIGSFFHLVKWDTLGKLALNGALVIAAILCTVLYYLPVTLVDAWLFQPFWPRFYSGIVWVGISVFSNILIFPLLFSVIRNLYFKECSKLTT